MKFINLCEAELETLKMMAANYPNSFVRERAHGVIMDRAQKLGTKQKVLVNLNKNKVLIKRKTCLLNERFRYLNR